MTVSASMTVSWHNWIMPAFVRWVGAIAFCSDNPVTRLGFPVGASRAAAERLLRSLTPIETVDLNDLYVPSADCDEACKARQLIGFEQPLTTCAITTDVGIIDTAVDATDPRLSGQEIIAKAFRNDDKQPSSSDHGTVVTAVIASNFSGAPRGSRFYVADSYFATSQGDRTDVCSLIEAFKDDLRCVT